MTAESRGLATENINWNPTKLPATTLNSLVSITHLKEGRGRERGGRERERERERGGREREREREREIEREREREKERERERDRGRERERERKRERFKITKFHRGRKIKTHACHIFGGYMLIGTIKKLTYLMYFLSLNLNAI